MSEASDQARRPGRKRKYSPEEAKNRLVAAAIDEVLRDGVAYGVEVRLDRVLVLADVPRGSAYALWEGLDHTPQEGLRLDTVLSILRDMPAGNAEPTREHALEIIARLGDDVTSPDLDVRRAARAKTIREVGVFNNGRLQSQLWRVYRSLVVSTTTQPDPDPAIVEAISQGEENLLEAYESLFSEFADVFAMKLKPGMTLRHFVMSVYALNEGLSNNLSATYDDQTMQLGADDAEWTVFAIGCEALFDRYFDFV